MSENNLDNGVVNAGLGAVSSESAQSEARGWDKYKYIYPPNARGQ